MHAILLAAALLAAASGVEVDEIDFRSDASNDHARTALERDERGDFHLTFDLRWNAPGRVLTVPGLLTIDVRPDGRLRTRSIRTDGSAVIQLGPRPVLRDETTSVGVSCALDVFARISVVHDDTQFALQNVDPLAITAEHIDLGGVGAARGFEGQVSDLRVGRGTRSTQALLRELAPERSAVARSVYADAAAWRDAERDFFAIEGDHLVWAPAQWREDPVPPGPLARTAAPQVMLPDGRIVVFSGEVRDTHHRPMDTVPDTWIYDPATTSWTELETQDHPGGRSHQAMAYDAANDRVLLIGGWDNGMGRSDHPNDRWALDLGSGRWNVLEEDVGDRFPNSNFAYLYHPRHEQVLVFGWRRAWLVGTDRSEPRALGRYGADELTHPARSAGYTLDPRTGRVWFFGGRSPEPDANGHYAYVDLTQYWDPDTESLVTVDVERHPTPRGRPLIGFDPELRRILMFGGSVTQSIRRGDLWSFDVDEKVWREHRQADTPGPRGGFMSPAFDAVRGELVMALGRSSRPRFHDDVWRLSFDPDATASLELELDRTLLPEARGVELVLSSVWQADLRADLVDLDADRVRLALTVSGVDEHNAVHVERVALATEPGVELPGETRLWLPLPAALASR